MGGKERTTTTIIITMTRKVLPICVVRLVASQDFKDHLSIWADLIYIHTYTYMRTYTYIHTHNPFFPFPPHPSLPICTFPVWDIYDFLDSLLFFHLLFII